MNKRQQKQAAKQLERAYEQLGAAEWLFIDALSAVYRPVRPLPILKGEPHNLALAHARLGGDFDLVILDGDPSELGFPYNALDELLPLLDESAYVLIHHAAHHRVAALVDALLAAHPELLDCGLIGRTAVWDVAHQAHYGGLRLLRYQRTRRMTVWAESGQDR